MSNRTLMHSSILAAIMIAAIIGVSMVTGQPGAQPFVTVDPLSDKTAGDTFTITGTTNLPAGTDILVQVYASSFEKHTSDTGEFSGAVGTVRTIAGAGGINTWSMDVDTSVFVPTEYIVNASVLTGDTGKRDFPAGSPFNTTTFTLRTGPATAVPSPGTGRTVAGGILIDPIPDTPRGSLLKVTGETNLSAGTPFLVKVIAASMDTETIAKNSKNPENIAVITVEKGDGINNRFAVMLDTRFLPLADHIIVVSEMKDPAAGISSDPGSLAGSALFNIVAPSAGTNASQGNLSVPGIFINPVHDVTAGDPITVTGMTNVPAGAKFKVFILPADSTDFHVPDDAATISAVKGSAIANLFATTLVTKGLVPGQYIIFVSAEDYEVTGSVLFTVVA